MYPIIASVTVLGLAIRTVYEFLKKAGRIDSRNQVVFSVVFFGMTTMLGSWVFLGYFDPLRLAPPPLVSWSGALLAAAGAALALSGVLRLRGLENITHFVTDGIYGRLRHPMYTGFMLWILGWTVFYGAALSSILAAACIADILLWREFEETDLNKKFGAAYLEYKKKTWF
jgi:protein-S-isoprenylcysteine O-methyltransferase Ste14